MRLDREVMVRKSCDLCSALTTVSLYCMSITINFQKVAWQAIGISNSASFGTPVGGKDILLVNIDNFNSYSSTSLYGTTFDDFTVDAFLGNGKLTKQYSIQF